MIRFIFIILILTIFLQKLLILEKYFTWGHLIHQNDEYLRIIAPTNDYYLITIDIASLKSQPIKWDWNLSDVYKSNPFPNSIFYSKLKNNNLYNNANMWLPFKINRKIFKNNNTTKSRNQYQSPTCISFCLSEMIENQLNLDQNLSAEYLHHWIKVYEKKHSKLNNNDWYSSNRGLDKPTLLWRGLQVLIEKGLRYDKLKYNNMKNYPIKKNLKKYKNNDNSLRNGKFFYLYRNNINNNQNCVNKLKDMMKDGPISITVVITNESFYQNNTNWKIKNNNTDIDSVISISKNKSVKDAHAILLYGYSDKVIFTKNDNKFNGGFIFKNSWGETWGSYGYSWITYDYLNKYLYEAVQYIPKN